jgi:hypothetical protein
MLVALLFAACGDTAVPNESTSVIEQAVVTGPPTSLTIALPSTLVPQAVPILATRTLLIKDRAAIRRKGDGFAPVVSSGTVRTDLGVEAKTGNVLSEPAVRISDRARVEGSVKSAGAVTLGQGVVVTEGVQANTPLGPLRSFTFQTMVPPKTFGNREAQPDTTMSLAPGGYGSLSVKSRATLNLRAGSYSFDSVQVEPQAKVVIDDAAGPVLVHARGAVTYRGQILKKGNAASNHVDLLAIAYGTATSFVEAPFKGTLFVPAAALVLQPLNGAEHFGAFFARDLTVEAGVVVRHQPFPWSKVLPPTPITFTDSPVSLEPGLKTGSGGGGGAGGSGGSGGSGAGTGGSGASGGSGGFGESGGNVAVVTLPGPISFEVPTEIWVSFGNAGNGTVELEFSTGGGQATVCTYTGGSPTNSPTTDLDLAKGRRYLFGVCTNGVTPGGTASADSFKLTVVSSADNFSGTAVSLSLGGGCSGELPAPITPEEVVAIRDGFNWLTVEELSLHDPDGRLALWHGLVYVDRPEQLQALDLWKVYWSARPISNTYADRFAGRCGRVGHASDGKGLIVYAVFPAGLFNVLRNFAIEAVLAGVEPPFKAIVPTPPEDPSYVNTDGSIRYEALASSGYADFLAAGPPQQPGWLGDVVNTISRPVKDAIKWVDDNIIDPVGQAADTGFSYVGSSWDSFVDWTATALDNGWEEIQLGLGNFVGLTGDEAEITLKLTMLNRDPLLIQPNGTQGNMIRTWGPVDPTTANGIPPIVPRGASAIIRQWGWGFLPVLNRARLGADGTTVIRTIEGAEERNGDGLCFELENADAMITTDFAANEVCNFLGPGYFQYDASVDVRSDHEDLHALTQLVDSADYARSVIGWSPSRVDVLTGWTANSITGLLNDFWATVSPFAEGNSRAMTLCFDFPFTGPLAIDFINTQVANSVGTGLAAPLLLKDMWWPDDRAPSRDSRGVMTHEYGHFLMCDMLYSMAEERNLGAGPPALSTLFNRVFDGQDDSRDDEIALVTESWADTFTMQVVGGSNYIHSDNATPGNELGPNTIYSMGFCTDEHCMDFNYVGQNDFAGTDPFIDELAKMQSTIHDAFDRSDSAHRLTPQPWNGDVWQRRPPEFPALAPLRFSATPYLGTADEPVSLVGSSWQDWVRNWAARGGHPVRSEYFGGLSDAMSVQGYSWCDRCEVFAVHEFRVTDPMTSSLSGNPSLYVPSGGGTGFADHFARWRICRDSSEIPTWIGGPREPFLNLSGGCEPCPPLNYSAGGICSPCQAGEVPRGDHCESCDSGTIPDPNTNSCTGCDRYEITVGNACVPCPVGHVADRATNTCVLCPPDLSIDLGTIDGCTHQSYIIDDTPPELDTCPDQTWVDVVNLDTIGECTDLAILAGVPGQATLDEEACPFYSARLEVFDPAFQTLFGASGPGVWETSPPPGRCELPSSTSLGAETIDAGLTAVRLRVSAEKQGFITEPWPVELTLTKVGEID